MHLKSIFFKRNPLLLTKRMNLEPMHDADETARIKNRVDLDVPI